MQKNYANLDKNNKVDFILLFLTAIIVAWLAKFHTGLMVLISVFVIFLERGTAHVADKCSGFDASASKIVIGLVLFFVIGSEFFVNYKLNFRGNQKEVA